MVDRFQTYANLMQKHIDEMVQSGGFLYRLTTIPDEVWEHYLNSFPEGTNPIFRVRREFDCSCCRSFIKRFGNVVLLKDGKITTIWDFEAFDFYNVVNESMRAYLAGKRIEDVFVPDSKERRIGTPSSKEMLEDGKIICWSHFSYDIPVDYVKKFTDKFKPTYSEGKNEIMGRVRDDASVFRRSLNEITDESVEIILDLISSGSIYRGEEWKSNLQKFQQMKKEYNKIADDYHKDLFAWEMSAIVGPVIARIRNHSIGTLLTNVSNGVDLDSAVKAWETVVAGPNYKRPKPIYTKRMIEDAKNAISEMGYMDSLKRRFAVLDDISVNDILFCNRSASSRIKQAKDVFEEMADSVAVNPKAFSKVEEVSVDTFISDILPKAKSIELFLESRLQKNLVSLLTAQIPSSKSMFKWNNTFSWAYTGNIADSFIKENVAKAGGNVSGDVRFSIQWNDGENPNKNDFDAHCIEPDGYELYFGNKWTFSRNKGMLDVDIIDPRTGVPAVENIFYPSKRSMREGVYKFFVHTYTNRGGRDGFKAQLEIEGRVWDFEYTVPTRSGEIVEVADVIYKNGEFTVKERLDSTTSSKTVWGLNTMQFYPVSVIMNSPNFWQGSSMTGNKHLFFMIDGLVNDECPNGFYNEFLVPELEKYRHVMEALGQKLSVVSADDQLSGVGFSSTIRNNVILMVITDTMIRTIKVVF